MNPCNRFEHVIQITLTTQFPESPDKLENIVKKSLGSWCKSAELLVSRDTNEDW